MADMISSCCETEVRLSVGLIQFGLPSKVIKSDIYGSKDLCLPPPFNIVRNFIVQLRIDNQ